MIRNELRKLIFQDGMKEAEIKLLPMRQAHGITNCISVSSSLIEIRIMASAITGHQPHLFLFSEAIDLTKQTRRYR
jgi:hypothetical protein